MILSDIPLHQLYDRADAGVEIDHFQPGDKADEEETMGAHRDDHYIFFLVEAGTAGLMIDFSSVAFEPGSLYFVLPGQVHHRISAEMAYGWFVAVDTGLLTAAQRQIFEERLTLQQPLVLNKADQVRYREMLQPLYHHYLNQNGQPFYLQVLYSLLQAFTGMVAAQYQAAESTGIIPNRKTQLTQAFKSLLTEKVKTIKSPSAYAELLHVSPSYLNEALKQTTGMPVSYWIMQEIMLEAKRLLYYTDSNVKEVAHQLGYDDHTYFSRLFKQQTNITPLDFRNRYRE